MIRIQKPKVAPAALAARSPKVAAMKRAVAASPATAGHPPKTFKFDNGIYGHRSVKDALLAAQRDKCAYCEGSFQAFSYGDIEHYRPKAYSQQSEKGVRTYPGYYWLAYSWENLLASCELCNRARKRNLFPLRNPKTRAADDAGLAHEEPLLLDPTGLSDPRDHIRFRDAAPEAKTDVGRASIRAYFLDRPHLTALRYKRLREAIAYKRIVDLAVRRKESDPELEKLAREAQAVLDEFTRPESEFSAMIIDYLGR